MADWKINDHLFSNGQKEKEVMVMIVVRIHRSDQSGSRRSCSGIYSFSFWRPKSIPKTYKIASKLELDLDFDLDMDFDLVMAWN